MWTEEPAFPTWIFLSICWSSDSGRGDVVCVNQLDATTAAVVPQQHLCSQRQREREKRKPFDIPIGNGSVCAEREKAQDDTWKETEACLDLSLYHNWLVKEHLKLFVFHVFTQTTFPFLILRRKDVQWNHWSWTLPGSNRPSSHTYSTTPLQFCWYRCMAKNKNLSLWANAHDTVFLRLKEGEVKQYTSWDDQELHAAGFHSGLVVFLWFLFIVPNFPLK